ncbi:unnamed protein product, partial [marine sediment metagenome]
VLLLMAAFAVAASAAAATGKQVTVTNGSGSNVIPWWPAIFPNGCRCQMLYDQAKISYAGTINEFELEKSNAYTCTATNVKFYLCHTKLATLTGNFKNNYGGNTPVGVAKFETYTVPARAGFYPIPMTTTFKYNNTENLILEITYEKITGSNCGLRNGGLSLHRCWGYGPTPTTGTADAVGYNGRISFSYFTALEPTSLGRVKSLFR